MEGSDAEIANRIARGSDRGAEDTLCRRFATAIHLYGMRHLRNETRAADLVQDVLLATIEALRAGRLEDPERLAHFVMGTSRNKVLEYRRSDRKDARAAGEVSAVPLVAPPVLPVVNTERFIECFGRLDGRSSSVLILTYQQDCSADEIASRLDVTPQNVRVIRHRALARMQQCIGLDTEAP